MTKFIKKLGHFATRKASSRSQDQTSNKLLLRIALDFHS